MSAKATEMVIDSCEVDFVDTKKVNNVRKAMQSADAVTLLADTFRLLGDATRIRIVFSLSREELCVCDIANLIRISQSAASHSLRSLRQMNLVKYRRVGKIAYYSLDDEHISNLIAEGFRHVNELLGE